MMLVLLRVTRRGLPRLSALRVGAAVSPRTSYHVIASRLMPLQLRKHSSEPNVLYSPLDESKKQIRLLRLGAGSADDEIHCGLEIVSLDEAPIYEALSYVWGDAQDRLPIRLAQETVSITRNLHNALKSLRFEGQDRIIWADALVINQQDLQERASQVKLMASLYSQASCVICYLGEDWDGCESVIKMALQMFGNRDLHLDSTAGPGLDIDGMNIRSKVLQKNIIQFATSPWFTRIWTLQESKLAKNTVLQYGKRSLNQAYFMWLIWIIEKHLTVCCVHLNAVLAPRDIYSALPSDNVLVALNRIYNWAFYDAKDPFIFKLTMFSERQSADMRDKVYGLLGLAPEDIASRIQPNYTLTPEEVFLSIAMADYHSSRQIRFLSCCLGAKYTELNLPSWVPDWTARKTNLVAIASRLLVQPYYNASGSQQADAVVLPGQTKLDVAGIVYDEIDMLGTVVKAGLDLAIIVQEAWDIAGLQQLSMQPMWDTTSDKVTAFWLTLIGGLWNDQPVENFSSKLKRVHSLHGFSAQSWMAWAMNYQTEGADDERMTIDRLAMVAIEGQRFARTAKGHLGCVPAKAQRGDVVALLGGGCMPYILRPTAGDSEHDRLYTLVGDAYIHGVMNGEAFAQSKLQEKDRIVLV